MQKSFNDRHLPPFIFRPSHSFDFYQKIKLKSAANLLISIKNT